MRIIMNLKEYKTEVEKLQEFARERNIPEAEVGRVFAESFARLEKRQFLKAVSGQLRALCLVIVLACVYLSFDRRLLTTTIVRNLQNSIYPGLKVLRHIAVPIIYRYPYLSELYDEWCLVENPFFHVDEIDCWPCTVVRSVPDLTGRNVTRSFNPGIPYTRSEEGTVVSLDDLRDLYWSHSDVFDRDSGRVSSTNFGLSRIRDVMTERLDRRPSDHSDSHVTWRINRMEPGRIVRKLFPKPVGTPDWWEQSIEKFVLLDEPRAAAYSLPNPECSNVVVRSAAGARLITMMPSAECSQSCQPSTILLSGGNTLWYNWWYWRPMSLPVTNSTEISISYLTSFC